MASSNLFFHNPLDSALLKSRRSVKPGEKSDPRGNYFRDVTAIIHSYPFRRLKHKTQVFYAPKNDHICTRIEHVMHVASIASTICRALDLNSDLAWAIGLGHDLGHTPFGHLGERILSSLSGKKFSHELYSLKTVDCLTMYGKGLNLTYAVRDGIVNHCGERFEQSLRPDFTVHKLEEITDRGCLPATWEGIAVRFSDKIAYLGRDFEDACHLQLTTADSLPPAAARVLGTTNAQMINTMVCDIIETSLQTGEIGFSDPVYEAMQMLVRFNYEQIYRNPKMTAYHDNFERILTTIYDYLLNLMQKYGRDSARYTEEPNSLAAHFADYLQKMAEYYTGKPDDEAAFDYLAGMTDDYAIDCVSEIMLPKSFQIKF